MSAIRPINHTVMPDGSEIWHYGDISEVEFDNEPINIFPPNVPTWKKRNCELSGIEWMERFGDYK